MIKNTALIVLAYAAIVCPASYAFLGAKFSINVLIGTMAVQLNIVALVYSWKRIFLKKSIALAVFVIIFKYVILGLTIWGLSTIGWLNIIGFLVGLASLVVSLLVVLLTKPVRSVNL